MATTDVATRGTAATEATLWHVRRQRAILKLHPEVRELFGQICADPT